MPAGLRVYAVGDVHGRLDLLDDLLAQIDADHAHRAPAEQLLIFMGDLVDRGPDSCGVVDRVRARVAGGKARLLMGNHEEILIAAARGDVGTARALLRVGGYATLESYGISRAEADEGGFEDLAAMLVERIPRADVAFLEGAEHMIRIGDYCFVHAGIRPGIDLDLQLTTDLRWIRDPFIGSKRDHGAVVVHGHTIAEEVQQFPNRIGIDTGAFFSGRLTALCLEGTRRWFIQAVGAPRDVTADM